MVDETQHGNGRGFRQYPFPFTFWPSRTCKRTKCIVHQRGRFERLDRTTRWSSSDQDSKSGSISQARRDIQSRLLPSSILQPVESQHAYRSETFYYRYLSEQRWLENGPHAGNTIIVVWSDHGWQLGEKKQWRKFTLWERSARVVMMMAGPGVTAMNKTSSRTVELLDVYPTLIDLCGLPERQELEGQSLRPLLIDPEASWNRPAITSLGPDKVTVRTERWRYSQFPDGEELYDHEKDPLEWHILVTLPEYEDTRKQLVSKLPKNPSSREIRPYSDLPEEQRRLFEVEPGRHFSSDQTNYVNLLETLD